MLSNQILHKIILDINRIIGVPCSVWSMERTCLAGTDEEGTEIESKLAASYEMLLAKGEKISKRGAFFLVRDNQEPVYILAIHEPVENVEVMGRLCVCQFENLLQAFKQRVDKNRFFQNLMLDNLLVVDIYQQAKKLGIEIEANRIVFVIEPKNEKDSLLLETMKALYASETNDLVITVDENHIIYVKHMDKLENYKNVAQIARAMVDTISTEVMINVRVAYGTIVNNIKDVSKSYKEATMALDVGKIFYEKQTVLAYSELGIGRLIHQLPVSLCEMFLNEVFTKNTIDQLDEETLSTVNLFFENSLNISETARKMYVHRNTLVYRLEKILKNTGLDVRVFDDALTFKIAMMVNKHMNALNNE